MTTTNPPPPEMEPETEPETETEAEVEAEDMAEPGPNWVEAFPKWGAAWELHVYSFGAIFLVMSLVALFSMMFYIRSCKQLKHGKTTFSLQCLLFLFSLLRGLSMFINPYLTASQLDPMFFTIIWTAALPGLTASFSLLLLILLDTTKMTMGPPRFQNINAILGVTGGHFVIVLISDGMCFWTATCKPFLMFCQTLFILYGSLLFVGYLYSAIHIYKSCKAGDKSGEEYAKIQRISRIAFAASLTSLSICVTYIYAASSDFGIYSDVRYVKAWDWWILQSVIRLEEIVSCCLVLIVVVRNPLESFCRRYFKRFAVKTRKVRSEPTLQSGWTCEKHTEFSKTQQSIGIGGVTTIQKF